MGISIGLLELKSIPIGIQTADEMIKAANVKLLTASPTCPGGSPSLAVTSVAQPPVPAVWSSVGTHPGLSPTPQALLGGLQEMHPLSVRLGFRAVPSSSHSWGGHLPHLAVVLAEFRESGRADVCSQGLGSRPVSLTPLHPSVLRGWCFCPGAWGEVPGVFSALFGYQENLGHWETGRAGQNFPGRGG